jgi:hypothetical protein
MKIFIHWRVTDSNNLHRIGWLTLYVLTECIINLHFYMTFHVTSHRLANHCGHVTALCHSSLIFFAVHVTRCSCLCPCHDGILGSRGKFHSIINSTLESCEWPSSRPGPFSPWHHGPYLPGTHCGPRPSIVPNDMWMMVGQNLLCGQFLCRTFNSRLPVTDGWGGCQESRHPRRVITMVFIERKYESSVTLLSDKNNHIHFVCLVFIP